MSTRKGQDLDDDHSPMRVPLGPREIAAVLEFREGSLRRQASRPGVLGLTHNPDGTSGVVTILSQEDVRNIEFGQQLRAASDTELDAITKVWEREVSQAKAMGDHAVPLVRARLDRDLNAVKAERQQRDQGVSQ